MDVNSNAAFYHKRGLKKLVLIREAINGLYRRSPTGFYDGDFMTMTDFNKKAHTQ